MLASDQTSHKIMGHSRNTTITRGLSTNTGGLLKSWFRIHRRTACQLSWSHDVSIGVAILYQVIASVLSPHCLGNACSDAGVRSAQEHVQIHSSFC